MFFVIWCLATVGCTIVLTRGKIFKTPRDWLSAKAYRVKIAEVDALRSNFFECPMCLGFWVGVFGQLLLPIPDLQPYRFMGPLAAGCAASYLSWFGTLLALRLSAAPHQ